MLSDVRMERSRRSRPMACEDACMYNKVSEYDQEIPKSHTADQPTAQ